MTAASNTTLISELQTFPGHQPSFRPISVQSQFVPLLQPQLTSCFVCPRPLQQLLQQKDSTCSLALPFLLSILTVVAQGEILLQTAELSLRPFE